MTSMSNRMKSIATRLNLTGNRRCAGPIGSMPDSYGINLRRVGRCGPRNRETVMTKIATKIATPSMTRIGT